MTSADIVRELRGARPGAPPALHARVAALASGPTTSAVRRVAPRRRRLFVAIPAFAALALAVGLGIALTDSPDGREALPTTAIERAGTAEAAPAPGTALDSQASSKLAGPTATAPAGRAQSFNASLTLRLDDADAVSEAARRTIETADELGGFVVSSQVSTGEQGYASITLRVPSEQAREAVARLSRLGTIVAQDVRLDDLQGTIDSLDARIRALRSQLAAVRAKLADEELDPAERARLVARRDALQAELTAARASRVATGDQAHLATVQVELRTEDGSTVVPVDTGVNRMLDRALAVLAWEGAALLALLIVVGPLVLVLVGAVVLHRTTRRRLDERTLSA